MLWHILGAGNMGAMAALYLERAGCRVRFIHPDHTAIQRRIHLPTGKTVDTNWPCSAMENTGDIRFLVVATKGPQTRPALSPLLDKLTPGATLLRLQNGMGTMDKMALPWHVKVVEAISFSGSYRNGSEQHIVAENVTMMGNGAETSPRWFERISDHWPHLRWETDIELHQLMKLAVNAVINPLTALHDCANGELAKNPAMADEATALAREVDSILRALRTDWPGHTAERSLGVARDTAANTSSMRSDVRAVQETEIDYINGWLLDKAHEQGIDAPLNRSIRERIKHARA